MVNDRRRVTISSLHEILGLMGGSSPRIIAILCIRGRLIETNLGLLCLALRKRPSIMGRMPTVSRNSPRPALLPTPRFSLIVSR